MRWILGISLSLPISALAQQAIGTQAAVEPLSSPYLLKLTAGLLLVVMVIFLFAWVLKKFNLTQQSKSGLLRIVAGLNLGTRDRIVLLQVGEEQILLGLSPGRIEKIHLLAIPLDCDSDEPGTPAFAQKLNQLMSRRAAQ